MTTTKAMTTPGAAARRLDDIEARIRALIEERERVIAETVADLEWMETPLRRIDGLWANNDLKPGDEAHIIDQLCEPTRGVRSYVHRADTCDDIWCEACGRREGVTKRTRNRRGNGFQHTFTGVWRVVALAGAYSGARALILAKV